MGLIPWIGTAALILVAAFSAGATLLSRFGRTRLLLSRLEPHLDEGTTPPASPPPHAASARNERWWWWLPRSRSGRHSYTVRSAMPTRSSGDAPSGSYADFRQVFVREAPAGVSVPATLRFPDQPRDRYPAVVVVHTISGFREANEGWLAAELGRSGFATLTYDSFSARGLSQSAVVGSRAGPPLASGVADAFAALQFLAGHPRIAADRIGIVGFSFGGEVAHLTAFETLRAAMGAGPSRFAAHVPTYPGGTYGVRAEAGAYTGAPILMLLGEKDDNLPVAKAEGYLAYAIAAGHPAPIATVVYPGAFHAWTVPTLGTRASTPSTSQLAEVPLHPVRARGAHRARGRARAAVRPGCARRVPSRGVGLLDGVRRGHPHQIRADTTAFLQRHLHP